MIIAVRFYKRSAFSIFYLLINILEVILSFGELGKT